ncbi:hypothetical protein [Dictyobacter formicarum]|uniref:DZANK-type domain-containing protein n=1 Tax=Dictyobacter formicarum TaxID=2778368 RepID=A0ABQ3V8F4_9CHLR|nr:hypothetical protein [Dictyobacter formicarum]GHO82244.1 hypothetical protein KSZ_02500 [Dictyobacter formicarum]
MSHTTQAIIILIGTTILVAIMIIIAETYGVKRYSCPACHTKQKSSTKNCTACGYYIDIQQKPKLEPFTNMPLAIAAPRRVQAAKTPCIPAIYLATTIAENEENIPTQLTNNHCPICKQYMNHEDLFCGYCGTKITAKI